MAITSSRRETNTRRLAARLTSAALLAALCLGCQEPRASVMVYKTPTCGCCSKWADHLRAAGYTVETQDLASVDRIKTEQHVPTELWSCHTAVLDGYVIEGHVPAADVDRLLRERPDVAGLAVRGMPIGSPGMEGPKPEAYTVYAFHTDGTLTPYAQHGP